MTDKKLAGKVALITGGARGLGRGYALRLAGMGADVAIIDRNLRAAAVYEFEQALLTADTVMAECEALGVRAMGIEADLTDRAATEKAVADIAAAMGRIDIAIANAGGGTVVFADERDPGAGANDPGAGANDPGAGANDPGAGANDPGAGANDVVDEVTTGTPADCDQAMLTRVLDLNVNTCMYTCMAVAPYMKRQGGGKIVTVSSTAGIDAHGSYHPYGTAKAAIIHYTRALAQELGPFNINVNAIAPGIIRTGRLGDRAAMAAEVVPLGREGTIEECAGVVEFLVTDLSDYVTGRTIMIDGGLVR